MVVPTVGRAALLALGVVVAGCSGGGGNGSEPLDESGVHQEAEAICTTGADRVDALPEVPDLAGLAGQRDDYLAAVDQGIAELRDVVERAAPGVGADLEVVVEALEAVRSAGADLLAAAAGGDPIEVVAVAQAAEPALAQLDQAAARLRAAACNSETWGRRLFIVAVELASP